MTLYLKHWHNARPEHWAASAQSNFALSSQPIIPVPIDPTSQWSEGGRYTHAAVVTCTICSEAILYRRIARKYLRKQGIGAFLSGRKSPHTLQLKSGQAHHSVVSDD